MIATDMARDSTSPPDDSWTVLYDGECNFCRTLLALILSADRDRRLRPLAIQTPEGDRLLADLTPEQRLASWHLVAPDGHRESAGGAGPPLLRLLPGGAAPAALLARAPKQTEHAYQWVAGHRSQLSRLVPSSAKRRAGRVVTQRTP
jgi:predicted DCC family thiol-disulfide oxidoreductase YuxK